MMAGRVGPPGPSGKNQGCPRIPRRAGVLHAANMNFDAPSAHAPATGDRSQPHTPRPTPGPERARPKRLFRDPDGLLGGVAAGIGAHLGIDPVIVRLGFVLGAIWGGGVLAYIVCWVVIPMAQRSSRRRPPQLLGST